GICGARGTRQRSHRGGVFTQLSQKRRAEGGGTNSSKVYQEPTICRRQAAQRGAVRRQRWQSPGASSGRSGAEVLLSSKGAAQRRQRGRSAEQLSQKTSPTLWR